MNLRSIILAAGRLAVASGLLPAIAASAADWPQWRGPGRDGVIPAASVPAVWPKQLKRLWTIEVGQGHAGPIVADGRVLLISRQGEEERVRAVRLDDGHEIWSHAYPAPYEPSPYALAHGKGPRSTPAVSGNRLVSVGVGSIVSCWDVPTGKRLWQWDFGKQFKPPSSLFYGMSVSPLILGKQVIVYAGVSGDGALMALDLDSGRLDWRWSGDGPGYSSPILATLGGTRQLILQSQLATIGVGPRDGKLLWSVPFKTRYDQNIITPVLAGDRFVIGGMGLPTAAYRIGRSDGRLTPKPLWQNDDIWLFMSTPVVVGDFVFGLSEHNKGQFFCLDAASGKVRWTSPGRTGENAVLMAAGRAILALTDKSELLVFKADPARFELLAKYTVADTPTWAHPAVVGDKILIKDRHALTAWKIAAEGK